ncbi:MAG: pyrimidine-nucleoside phosphorylase [Anaerostipes sp.]|jgi:pyrimidine-nucleoside phosphorylase
MRMTDIIKKKRDGEKLSKEEIDWMIKEYCKDEIPDYQMSALMMAVFYQGMDKDETFYLTMAMKDSGDTLDLSQIPGIKVDKHSTGGVGDKTSIALGPLVASCGVPVAKMSGRGLGHTGGTIDKLESIHGFTTNLTEEQFIKQVKEIGIAIMGQTKDLAPADKKLYALRDVTETVDQLSLIASSIMSKKLAAGADGIVLDVKTGNGAFMQNLADAQNLAREMLQIGSQAGKSMTAVISNMNQPLGNAIGNALEVKEAIDTLQGNGPKDFTELVLTLGSYMLVTGKIAENEIDARKMLEYHMKDGTAFEKFVAFVKAQGGEESYVRDVTKLPKATIIEEIETKERGYISFMDTAEIGICSLILGGGRETKESIIDPAVGLIIKKKVGDFVEKGECLAVIHGNDKEKVQQAKEHYLSHIKLSNEKIEKETLIFDVIHA